MRIPRPSTRPFLLIVRTCRIFTARAVAQDPRSSQQIARFVLGKSCRALLTEQASIERCGRPTARISQTVSRRSEPSSRTALMGEQPNPWEVLPPQDATSRHRAISAVTGGADYLSTLHPIGARGRRLMATTDFIRARMSIAISPLVVERISRYRVMPGSCTQSCSASEAGSVRRTDRRS